MAAVVMHSTPAGSTFGPDGKLAWDAEHTVTGLATVAESGAYSDLTGKPTLGTAAATAITDYATSVQGAKADTALQNAAAFDAAGVAAAGDSAHVAAADPHTVYALEASLSTVATSGAYTDLTGKPTLGTAAATAIGDYATAAQGVDARTPLAHVHAAADITGTAVLTADSRLSDARTPLAHAASHTTGADKIATGTPDGSKFLRDDFSWQALPASVNRSPTASFVVAAGYSAIASKYWEVTEPMTIEIAATAHMEVLE